MPASSASATATRAGRLFHCAAACVRASRASSARESPSPGCEVTTPRISALRQRTTQGRNGSRPGRGIQVSSRMAPNSQVSNGSFVVLAKIGLTAGSMPSSFRDRHGMLRQRSTNREMEDREDTAGLHSGDVM